MDVPGFFGDCGRDGGRRQKKGEPGGGLAVHAAEQTGADGSAAARSSRNYGNRLGQTDHNSIARVDGVQRLAADVAAIGDPQNDSDHHHHDADHIRLPPGGVGLLVEQVSDDADGNGPDGEQPKQVGVLLQIRISADVDAETMRDDLHPVLEKVNDDRNQGARVESDVKEQAAVAPAQQPGDQHQVRGTANGNEFCSSLNDPENYRMRDGH